MNISAAGYSLIVLFAIATSSLEIVSPTPPIRVKNGYESTGPPYPTPSLFLDEKREKASSLPSNSIWAYTFSNAGVAKYEYLPTHRKPDQRMLI